MLSLNNTFLDILSYCYLWTDSIHKMVFTLWIDMFLPYILIDHSDHFGNNV